MTRTPAIPLLILALALGGCGRKPARVGSGGPADPAAAQAPAPSPSTALKLGVAPRSIDASDRAAEASEPAPGEYFCPMHHQIRRPAPGECPICGMKLVQAPPAPAAKEAKP